MFTKNCHLKFNLSENNTFEETYNQLTYKSNSSRMRNLKIIPDKDKIYFNGIRSVAVPLHEKLGSECPSEIGIILKGYTDSYGNTEITYTIPDTYKDYVIGREKIKMNSEDKSIHIYLEYTTKKCDTDVSMMQYIQNKAYNKLLEATESHIITMYTYKRKSSFDTPCRISISNLEELKTSIC